MTLLKAVIPAALLTLVVSGAAVAATGPQTADTNAAGQNITLTPEQWGQYRKMHDDYVEKIMPMHDQLEGKYLELRALTGINGTTKEDISGLVREITTLKAKMHEERSAFFRSLDKAGLSACRGDHAGMGMMGMGGCPGACGDGGAFMDAGPGMGGCMGGGMMGGHNGMGGHGGPRHGGMGARGPHHGDR